jgi:VanZ family protein
MKVAPLYHALNKTDWANPVLVHSGQHYDHNIWDVIFQGRQVAAYATLAVLSMWTLVAIDTWTIRLLASLVITVGLGVTLEWYQSTVPGRFGTLTDVLLNIGGAVVGILLAIALL